MSWRKGRGKRVGGEHGAVYSSPSRPLLVLSPWARRPCAQRTSTTTWPRSMCVHAVVTFVIFQGTGVGGPRLGAREGSARPPVHPTTTGAFSQHRAPCHTHPAAPARGLALTRRRAFAPSDRAPVDACLLLYAPHAHNCGCRVGSTVRLPETAPNLERNN